MPKTLALNLIKSLYVTSGLQKTGDGKQVKKKNQQNLECHGTTDSVSKKSLPEKWVMEVMNTSDKKKFKTHVNHNHSSNKISLC